MVIQLTAVIYCEEPPTLLYDNLYQQDVRVRVGDPMSPIHTTGHPTLATAETERQLANEIARVIATHHDYLPDVHEGLLYGPITTKDESKIRDDKYCKL